MTWSETTRASPSLRIRTLRNKSSIAEPAMAAIGWRMVVNSGQTVVAGQMIGRVGSTGSSTANHLHFEVHINGSVVDPWAWLVANAG